MDWLNNAQEESKRTGFDLLLETARFWVSRATQNTYGKYDINGTFHQAFTAVYTLKNGLVLERFLK